MFEEDKNPEKIYYTIGEVAAMFDLNVSNVRYWENEFDILMPKKNAKGDRFFTKKDIGNIRIIKELVKERGYTVEGAKIKLREKSDDLHQRMKMVNSLENVKSFLVQLKSQLENNSTEKSSVTVAEEAHDAQQSVITFMAPEQHE
ncbi:MAG: MerR family transcriptional regulator [Bacteroidota bacterium]